MEVWGGRLWLLQSSIDGQQVGLGVEKAHPLSGDLFVFLNARGNLVKTLFWDRTGFIIIAKRLERCRFRLRNQAEKLVMTPQALELLLDGIPAGGQSLNEVTGTVAMS